MAPVLKYRSASILFFKVKSRMYQSACDFNDMCHWISVGQPSNDGSYYVC